MLYSRDQHLKNSQIKVILRNVFLNFLYKQKKRFIGLIGKSVQRFFNRIWNYLIKGVMGTVAIATIMPPLCIGLSLGSLLLALLTPIW
jgi:hypothetical protein